MKILAWLGRGMLALFGLLVAADAVGNLYFAITRHMAVSPPQASTLMWDAWVVSWIAAMVWSRRAAARPPALSTASLSRGSFEHR